ncbi:MAG TPA: class I SAM-dependent methyltransferase family protein [Methanocella sp.]|nr:class I SAM-dependent methyltransferase family protein [Methanocella sp.]
MGKNNAKLMMTKNRGKPIPTNPLKTVLKDLTPEEEAAIPKSWQVIGDVLLVHVPDMLQLRKKEIGEAFLRLYPRCKTVLETKRIAGDYREPIVEKIAGNDDTETIHKENYVLYKLNAAKIMFSQGNFYERRRMSTLGSGEHVVDMFAGIGYFTLPMAVHAKPRMIDAIEINPASYSYLCENIRLNKVEGIVNPILGDCRKKAPTGGAADRVIMGYVGTTHEFLPWGIRALRPGGILHYHETTPEKLLYIRPAEYIGAAAKSQGRRAKILDIIKIKKYSPGVWHIVVDAKIEG